MSLNREIFVRAVVLPGVLILIVGGSLAVGWSVFSGEKEMRKARYDKYVSDLASVRAIAPQLPALQERLTELTVLLASDQYVAASEVLGFIESQGSDSGLRRTTFKREIATGAELFRSLGSSSLGIGWVGSFFDIQKASLLLERSRPNLILSSLRIEKDGETAESRLRASQGYSAVEAVTGEVVASEHAL